MPGGGTHEDWSKVVEYLKDYNSNSKSNKAPGLDSITSDVCHAAWELLGEEQQDVLDGKTEAGDDHPVEDSTETLRVRRRAIQWLMDLEENTAYVDTTTIATARHLSRPSPSWSSVAAVGPSKVTKQDQDATEVHAPPPSIPISTPQKRHLRSDNLVKPSNTPAVETTGASVIEIIAIESTEAPQPQENSNIPAEECSVEQDDLNLSDHAQALPSHGTHVPTSVSGDLAINTSGQSVPLQESEPTPAALDDTAGICASLDDPVQETTSNTNESPPIQETVDPSQDNNDMDDLGVRIQNLRNPNGTTIKQLTSERDDRGEMVETLWKQMQELTTRQEKHAQERQTWEAQRQQAQERAQELGLEKERLVAEQKSTCEELASQRQNFTARLDAERKSWRVFRERAVNQQQDFYAEKARLETQIAVDKARLETTVAVAKAKLVKQMADEKVKLETQMADDKELLEIEYEAIRRLGVSELAAEKKAHTEEIHALNAKWTQQTTQETRKQQLAIDSLKHEWQGERAFLLSSIEKLQAALSMTTDAGPSPSSVPLSPASMPQLPPKQHQQQQQRQVKEVEVELKRSRQEIIDMQQRLQDVEQLNKDYMDIIKTQVSTIHTATQENARKRRRLDADKVGNKENQ
ncbi:hypothetical protein BGZ96_012269 [Linnemannia gamsii]|uniref:Uncharacterized protein n=1 Tax=Linnemannia gamsii TaxID=64522 RepID=A0ABQ7JR07_9FUNG|nr:hypothetical protein BGZ96_012269 [Linnemannia gamsii]